VVNDNDAQGHEGGVVRPHRILFVCTANICRSPMGEAFAREYGAERGWAVEARSCGVNALPGNHAAAKSIRAMAEIGIDISAHRSTPMDAEQIRWADYILVMEIRHASRVHDRHPEANGRVMMLGSFGGVMEIEDPYGTWFMRSFRSSRDEIQRCVTTFMDRLPLRALPAGPKLLEATE
jgi:protein-tyrosine-phosphatase